MTAGVLAPPHTEDYLRGMRNTLLSLFAALMLVACGGPELEGTWTLHPDSAAEMIKSVPDARRAEAHAAAKQISMTFNDGKCTMRVPNLGNREGTYTIKSTDGNKLTVVMEFEGNYRFRLGHVWVI